MNNIEIKGAGGGKGGKIVPNSMFSTDVVFLTVGLSEGPIYRVNPNGPQDIQIADNTIDDLIKEDGTADLKKFTTAVAYGTVTQDPLPLFGEAIITPQSFASPIKLKKGNLPGVPEAKVILQETSKVNWDSIKFNFIVEQLGNGDKKGNISERSLTLKVTVYDHLGIDVISYITIVITGKTDTPFKRSVQYNVPSDRKSDEGYRFTVEKITNEVDDSYIQEEVSFIGWEEIKNTPQAYPRTAVIGYALKAFNEHTGGMPTFTSLVKGLIIRVPSNYNQPILENEEIDWRQLETGVDRYTVNGYQLQQSGHAVTLYEPNPYLYTGVWDGTFVYSWSQNPVWIVYDILTNKVYGLGIPEEYIDKYKFYQVAQYCDGCSVDGRFEGVSAIADGSFRYKPKNTYLSVKESQIGLPKGSKVAERRFILDYAIEEQEKTMDILNKLTSSFRSLLLYSGGKITLATDMPEQYPVMLFNDANIKEGSLSISGAKESEIFTGVDVTYMEPTNHYKRETVRVDNYEAYDNEELAIVENVAALDMPGVSRRSQAMRAAHYHLASSKYQRRSVSFETGTEALSLTPGDIISVATKVSGINYGYSGKISGNSSLSNTSIFLEHFTTPSLSNITFTANSKPLALRVMKPDIERLDLYLISNTNFSLTATGNTVNSVDSATVRPISVFNYLTKSFEPISGFNSINVPAVGDLWSLGEISNPNNYFSSQADKLFKVTNISRDTKDNTVDVAAIEYISNVYVDSDTFINYEPAAYIDLLSPFAAPPTPKLQLTIKQKVGNDGSVLNDCVISDYTDKNGYIQKFTTEYYVNANTESKSVSNVFTSSSGVTIHQPNHNLEENVVVALVGKSGFETSPGTIELVVNNTTITDLENITLSVKGLHLCVDDNFSMPVLDSYYSDSAPTLKGVPYIRLPVVQNNNTQQPLNTVGYYPYYNYITVPIHTYNIAANTITIKNTVTDVQDINSVLGATPFYASIAQILAPNNYNNNSFYISGVTNTKVYEGILSSNTDQTITLPVTPIHSNFVKLYLDGIAFTAFTMNGSNINFTRSNQNTYRIETEIKNPPCIEIGDILQVTHNNFMTVTSTSYSPNSANFSSLLTTNNIFKVTTDTAPNLDLSTFTLINTSSNPVGTISNVTSSSFTLDFDSSEYNNQYDSINSNYNIIYGTPQRVFFDNEQTVLTNVPFGTLVVKARNRNVIGRLSPFTEKLVEVRPIPIQRVENLSVSESLYREQTGGISVRATISFDHISNQEVTDYEISYKLDSAENLGLDDGGSGLTNFNTVKVSAEGAVDGKIHFTINNINRGLIAYTNNLTIRVTPLNRGYKGILAETTYLIKGKTTPPQNIKNFVAGQQGNIVSFIWGYETVNNDLADIDLQEVIIVKVPGTVDITSDNFFIGTPCISVSPPSTRKTAPIDYYGTFTYLVKTKDTSGNLSTDTVGTVLTLAKAFSDKTVFAYSEDDPSETYTAISNNNALEYFYPSFSNTVTGGLKMAGSTYVDNANGSSSGWSSSLTEDNLFAAGNAVYTTSIRSFNSVVNGVLVVELDYNQVLDDAYRTLYTPIISSVSIPNSNSSILYDTSYGGIGAMISATSPRFDTENKTLMSGPINGNVYAIIQTGNYIGDVANANATALLAQVVNANAVSLSSTYFANGKFTSSNSLANLTTKASSYSLVNLTQYNDTGASSTYQGEHRAVTASLEVRTSSANSVYYANGNVNISQFDNYAINEGFRPFEISEINTKHIQLRLTVNNNSPDKYSFILDKFKYYFDKSTVVFTETKTYSSNPTVVSLESANFMQRPVISYAVLDQIGLASNAAMVVTTDANNKSLAFRMVYANGSGDYLANSSANVMITAIGV